MRRNNTQIVEYILSNMLWLVIPALAAVISVTCYRKRLQILKKLRYWYSMARGKSVAAKYLCYEGDEWDQKNPVRTQHKAQRIDSVLFFFVAASPYMAIALWLFLPDLIMPAVLGIVVLVIVSQIWKFGRAYHETVKYGGSLNLHLFYQYLDGREGEVLLQEVRMSDRITCKPRELLTALETSEHFIQSGIDERKLVAEIGKKYLDAELTSKLDKLEELSRGRDQDTRESLKSIVILHKYFSFGEDDAEISELFKPQAKAALDQFRHLLKKTNITTDPAQLIVAYIQWKDLSPESLVKLKDGTLTPQLKSKLDNLEKDAKENDANAKSLLRQMELIRKFYALGILQESGELVETGRYEPHIYSAIPGNGDLRRRCVLVLPCEFGKAVKNDSRIPVAFDYATLETPGSDLEAIRLDDSLEELLVNEQTQHGVTIQLPKDMFAITNRVPVFIITRSDQTEEQLRQGMRITMPPSLIGLFVKAVHAVIDHSWLAEKLAKSYSRIRQLEESKDEDTALKEGQETRRDLDIGQLLQPNELPVREVKVPGPIPVWKIALLLLIGTGIGALALYIGLRALGWHFASPWGDII